MSKSKVAIVIPAWNEEARLPDVLIGLRATGCDVIVVDDGSTDDTVKLARDNDAKVLTHIINRFQGAALRTGTKYALANGYEYIVHFDADGQFRAIDIPVLLKPLFDGEADVVFGSRFIDNSTQMPAMKKRVIMPLARLVNYILLGVNLSDPQSGFRAFRSDAFDRLNWKQDGWAHCSEIMFQAHRNKLRIKEVPITVLYHEFGQKLSSGFGILKDLLLARLLN